jgi:hypothetical protein
MLGETGGAAVEIKVDGRDAISAAVNELSEVYEAALERALRTEAAAVAAD